MMKKICVRCCVALILSVSCFHMVVWALAPVHRSLEGVTDQDYLQLAQKVKEASDVSADLSALKEQALLQLNTLVMQIRAEENDDDFSLDALELEELWLLFYKNERQVLEKLKAHMYFPHWRKSQEEHGYTDPDISLFDNEEYFVKLCRDRKILKMVQHIYSYIRFLGHNITVNNRLLGFAPFFNEAYVREAKWAKEYDPKQRFVALKEEIREQPWINYSWVAKALAVAHSTNADSVVLDKESFISQYRLGLQEVPGETEPCYGWGHGFAVRGDAGLTIFNKNQLIEEDVSVAEPTVLSPGKAGGNTWTGELFVPQVKIPKNKRTVALKGSGNFELQFVHQVGNGEERLFPHNQRIHVHLVPGQTFYVPLPEKDIAGNPMENMFTMELHHFSHPTTLQDMFFVPEQLGLLEKTIQDIEGEASKAGQSVQERIRYLAQRDIAAIASNDQLKAVIGFGSNCIETPQEVARIAHDKNVQILGLAGGIGHNMPGESLTDAYESFIKAKDWTLGEKSEGGELSLHYTSQLFKKDVKKKIVEDAPALLAQLKEGVKNLSDPQGELRNRMEPYLTEADVYLEMVLAQYVEQYNYDLSQIRVVDRHYDPVVGDALDDFLEQDAKNKVIILDDTSTHSGENATHMKDILITSGLLAATDLKDFAENTVLVQEPFMQKRAMGTMAMHFDEGWPLGYAASQPVYEEKDPNVKGAYLQALKREFDRWDVYRAQFILKDPDHAESKPEFFKRPDVLSSLAQVEVLLRSA